MGKMKMAAKFGIPIICFIDTGGAYPGIGAEERGSSHGHRHFDVRNVPGCRPPLFAS